MNSKCQGHSIKRDWPYTSLQIPTIRNDNLSPWFAPLTYLASVHSAPLTLPGIKHLHPAPVSKKARSQPVFCGSSHFTHMYLICPGLTLPFLSFLCVAYLVCLEAVKFIYLVSTLPPLENLTHWKGRPLSRFVIWAQANKGLNRG